MMFSPFRINQLFCRSSSSSSSQLLLKFFTRSQARELSSSSSSDSDSSCSSGKVLVWWNADECEVPPGVSFSKVAPSITAAVRANGIKGYIVIYAYGHFYSSKKFDQKARQELCSTGVFLHTVREENGAHKSILMDLRDEFFLTPPPLHLFLIFGSNRDFSGMLHRLRMRNYNILLACPGKAHLAVCHAATKMWQWSSMLNGEDLIGKHFNYPPDGPFNSWYENSNVPLENLFLTTDQTTSSLNAEEIYKPSSDIKLGEISRQVLKILSSHPNGISIGDLRAKLTMCDMPLGKCFYGYKKFSNFLVSIPHVQLQYLGEGNFWVCLVPSTTSTGKNKQKDSTASKKLHNEGKNMDTSADGIPIISSSYVSSEGDDSESFQSMPSQGKSIGDYVDGKSSFPSFKESNVHRDVISSRNPELFEDSKLYEVNQSASHFEEPKSSELQQDVCHPQHPHWDDIQVGVWWDFNSCGVPSDISYLNVAPSIMGVLRANGIKGPILIDAYGDVSRLSEIEQEALLLSGIDLHHIPGGKRNSYNWLSDWVSQKPPPAHLFLISGEEDEYFSGMVHRLKWGQHNILLACPRRGHVAVHEAVTIVWWWSSMLKGVYLTGKYFNHPPKWYFKGRVPLEYPPEWYRNSNVPPLENPFSSSQNGEINEPSSYINLVEVPKPFSRRVRKILSSYPNGISIGDLWIQIGINYLCTLGNPLNKAFYKLEVLSNILVSIPYVQLLYIGDDNFCVRLNKQRIVKNKQRVGVNHSRMPVLFSTGSFWDDMESFVFTSRGSRLLSRSRSREDLAHKLQKYGPLFLVSLTRNDILQLVELLIAEKKWLEESPSSQAFPFRLLTQPVHKSSSSHCVNGFI